MTPLRLDPIANSPGFFRVQKVRGGAWLPGRMWVQYQLDDAGDRIADDRYFCELGTELVDPFNPPGWPYGWQPIEEWNWRHLQADLAWSLANDRHGPMANPDVPARVTERALF